VRFLRKSIAFAVRLDGYFTPKGAKWTSFSQFCREKFMPRLTDAEVLLTPSEVAALFRVDPKTVTRWAKAGKLTSIRTLGGHRRYRESEVRELLKNHLDTKG
jgi:excisionase family DNA binding protein